MSSFKLHKSVIEDLNGIWGYVAGEASRGVFSVRTMFSPEALTVTHGRYPLFFQEGETWKNIPILHGQHPHDFAKELAVAYQYRLGE